MNPRTRALIQVAILLVVVAGLALVFPRVDAFVERAARELRYFWWLILMVALGLWLVFGLGRKSKR